MVTIRPEGKLPRTARRLIVVGNLLMILGLIVMIFVAGTYVYGQIEERRFAEESLQRRQQFEDELAALEQQRADEAARVEQERQALLNAPLPVLRPDPSTTAVPAPSKAGPARRIIIPAIGVDSEVVEAEVRNGEWLVPKFVVGHLQGTAQPGQQGNSAYSGHLQSVSGGNVFARLNELRVGDHIYLISAEGQFVYEIQDSKVVANTDLSVVQPTDDAAVTLITCTGTWDFVARDYLQRLVITAKLYQDTPPAHLPVRPRG